MTLFRGNAPQGQWGRQGVAERLSRKLDSGVSPQNSDFRQLRRARLQGVFVFRFIRAIQAVMK